MKPLISIIVPVYNVDKYIRKCLDSILLQTLSDFELIIVDDGSTDRSSEICDDYDRKDERIKVIHKMNGGLSSARNAGLDLASGQYIAMIDSDDWIAEDMLEVLYCSIKEYKADIAQCEFIKMKYDKVTGQEENRYGQPVLCSSIDILNKFHNKNAITYTVVWNKLYKADLFRGIRFPEGKLHEDEFVNYRIVHRAKNIACCGQKLYFYRQRANSIMSKKFNLSRLDRIEAYVQRKDYYRKLKLNELYRMELLHLPKEISWMYMQVKSKVEDNKKAILFLKRQYRSVFLELVRSGISFKTLLCYSLNCIAPDLYNMETKE